MNNNSSLKQRLRDGIVNYGEGDIANPKCTISMTLESLTGILLGGLDAAV